MVLEKTLESPLNSQGGREIQSVHPKGNQSCTGIVGAIDDFQRQRLSLGQQERHRSRIQSSDSKIMSLS